MTFDRKKAECESVDRWIAAHKSGDESDPRPEKIDREWLWNRMADANTFTPHARVLDHDGAQILFTSLELTQAALARLRDEHTELLQERDQLRTAAAQKDLALDILTSPRLPERVDSGVTIIIGETKVRIER